MCARVRLCALSAGPPPGPAGSQPRLVAAVLLIIICCPPAQRGTGAAVPRPSRSEPGRAVRGRPQLPYGDCGPPRVSSGSPGASRGAELGGGRDGGAGQGPGERAERRDRGREEWRDAGGGVSAEGGRREGGTVGFVSQPGPGGAGRAIGAATHLCHSLGSGCAEEAGLGTRTPPQQQGRGSV